MAYTHSIKFIQETVNRINRADNKINKLNKQIAEAIDSSDDEESGLETLLSDNDSDEFEDDQEKAVYRQ